MVLLPSELPKPKLVKERVAITRNKKYKHLYECFCNNLFTAIGSDVNSKRTQSCGCWKKFVAQLVNSKHRLNKTPEHRAWVEMKRRCFDKRRPNYNDYGGRGITVCEDWINNFIAFLKHVGPKPLPNKLYSLDRIDNNGDYAPGNVRWATREQQNNNQRRSKLTNG